MTGASAWDKNGKKTLDGTVAPGKKLSGVIVYVKGVRKENTAIKEGMLSLLRAEIIRQHDKYTQRQYCPIYAKDALTKAYAAYHSLGGNGTITKIYNETMQLPETAEEVKQ